MLFVHSHLKPSTNSLVMDEGKLKIINQNYTTDANN